MNENKEKLLNLLADQTLFGLSDTEAAELKKLKQEFPEFQDDNSFELAAAAINLSNLEIKIALPAHLQARILEDADTFFAAAENKQEVFEFEPKPEISARSRVFSNLTENLTEEVKVPWWGWLGWGAAALACVALAFNLWLTRVQPKPEIAKNPETIQTPTPELTVGQKRRQLLASAADVIQTSWTEPNAKGSTQISGDVVWSNSAQKGYVRFRGLPANDPNKETYQLWIIDENQPDKYPVDGGVFDISENGEVVIPIDAKINVKKPKMFAVTMEKPGGVVVSNRRKLVAIAKI